MTREFFTKAMEELRKFYATLKLDDGEMRSWWNHLSFYPDEVIAAAIVHMMHTVPAFPSIQQVTSFIRETQRVPVEQAFVEARRKAPYLRSPLFKAGEKVPVRWTDPAIHQAIEAIGLNEFLNCPSEQMTVLRAQFKKAYENILDRREMDTLLGLAIGGNSPVVMLVTGDTQGLHRLNLQLKAAETPAQLQAGKAQLNASNCDKADRRSA